MAKAQVGAALLALAVMAMSAPAGAEDQDAARREAKVRTSVTSPYLEATLIVDQIAQAKKKLAVAQRTQDRAVFEQLVDAPLADRLHRWQIVKETKASEAAQFQSCGDAAWEFRKYANTFVAPDGPRNREDREGFAHFYTVALKSCQVAIARQP